MGFFKPISRIDKRLGGLSITADKYERLCLSKELQKELQFVNGIELYLFFDDEERRIGITVQKQSDQTPYIFDKKAYATASDFMERCGIDTSEQPIKFLYEGTEKGILAFRQVGIRKPQTFKAEKNGNLEEVKKRGN
jgi:hypothetical protein